MKQGFRGFVAVGCWLGAMVAGCDGDSPAVAADVSLPDSQVDDNDAARTDVGAVPCVDETHVRPIFAAHCAACHGAVRPSAGLDLATPGVLERIAERTSVHAVCRDVPIAVPGAPAEGVFMGKLLGTLVDCGEPMPPSGPLAPAELQCLARWISAARTAP